MDIQDIFYRLLAYFAGVPEGIFGYVILFVLAFGVALLAFFAWNYLKGRTSNPFGD